LLVALAYSKAGLPDDLCIFFARALEQMQYYMITAHGVSEEYNKNTVATPLHGLGQGSTDGPSGWNFLSDKIIKAHNKRAKGSVLYDPTKQITVKRSADKFVDDASLINNDTEFNASPEIIMSYVQNDIQSWGTFLQISGGLLELTKTMYLMLIWKFQADGQMEHPPYRQKKHYQRIQ
jgi:hypothetical protein